MSTLSKRVILITGANKGIGLETARQLGKEGHTIIVAARDEKKAQAAVAELSQEGVDARPLVLDVTSAESIAQAAKQIEQQFGKLDTLINNAGLALEGWGSKASTTPVDDWRKIYETNVFGLVAVT